MRKIVWVYVLLFLVAVGASFSFAEVEVVDLTQITKEVRGGAFLSFKNGIYGESHIPVLRLKSPKSGREYINANLLGITLKKLDNEKIKGRYSPSITFRFDSILQKISELSKGWIVSAKLPPIELGVSSLLELSDLGKICAEWGLMASLKFGAVK